MASQEEIDALVKLLDQQMNTGVNHVNIECENPEEIKIENISVLSGMDCDLGDTACKIPNIDLGEEYK